MAGIICGSLALVSTLALAIVNMDKSLPTKAAETSTDTGAAKVTAVTITQAGTGASVTIGGETTTPTGESLDETKYGDNTTRRKILNNNVVVYKVNYNVTKAGKVTLKFKLPANTPIDKSSIASCADGSKLSTESSVNPWNGKTEQSYAYNVAECVVDASGSGSGEWVVKANLWGGNGEKITPTVSVDGVTQDVSIEPITILARAKYYAVLSVAGGGEQGVLNGWNRNATIGVVLWSARDTQLGTLGIEPLSNDVDLPIENDLPNGWDFYSTSISPSKSYYIDGNQYGVVNVGKLAVGKTSSNIAMNSIKEIVTGGIWCPSAMSSSWMAPKDRCFLGRVDNYYQVPSSSLGNDLHVYTAKLPTKEYATRSGVWTTINGGRVSWNNVYNASYGNPVSWGGPPSAKYRMTGGDDSWYYNDDRPVYRGESIWRGFYVQLNTAPYGSYSNNYYACQTFNPELARLESGFQLGSSSEYYGFNVPAGSTTGAEYGVIGNDSDTLPTSNKISCGQYGKDNVMDSNGIITAKFFDNLSDAQKYAGSIDGRVNSIRLYANKISLGIRNGYTGVFKIKMLGTSDQADNGEKVFFNSSGETDEWNKKGDGTDSQDPYHGPYANYGVKLVPGFLQPKFSLSSDKRLPRKYTNGNDNATNLE